MKWWAHRFIIVSSLIIILFVAVCPLVSARGYIDPNGPFKSVAVSTFDGDGDISVSASNYDFGTGADGTFSFRSYLTENVNIVGIRCGLGNGLFNTQLINWWYIVPHIIAGNTNCYYYTFYVVPSDYNGRIATNDISRSEYVYSATYTFYNSVLEFVNESYGFKFNGSSNGVTFTGTANGECDIIIVGYMSTATGSVVINFNPLDVSNGQGQRPNTDSINPGYNAPPELPIDDDWLSQLTNDKQIYADLDVKINDILDYASNPATILNTAMDRTRSTFDWPETHLVLYFINKFFGIPLVSTLAWVIALFGSVFSLFNLAISFVPNGHGSTPTSRINPTSYGIQRRHLTQGEYGKRR